MYSFFGAPLLLVTILLTPLSANASIWDILLPHSKGGGSKSSGSSSGKKNAAVYLGFGGGRSTAKSPSSGFTPSSSLTALFGAEIRFFQSSVLFDLGGQGFLSAGQLDYDYMGSDAHLYTATKVDYNASSAQFTAGLKLRLIDADLLRLYIEGGGLWGSEELRPNTSKANLASQGSKFLEKESGIGLHGYFGDVGMDLGDPGHGVRLAGRYNFYQSDAIKILNGKKTEWSDLIAYVAVYTGF